MLQMEWLSMFILLILLTPFSHKILFLLLAVPSSSVLQLLHPVEGGSSLEPLDLCLVEGVVELQ